MDTITHALSGVLLGRAITPDNKDTGNSLTLRARLTAGFFAAAFPDIDIIARFFNTITYLEMHRGITHSVLLLPVWALLLSFCYSKISGNKYHWKDFYLISFSGIAIHIGGDVITAYGTMIFAPLSTMKLAWPTTFIIDFYFTGIILCAIIFAAIFRNRGKYIAIAGLVLLLFYIGYQGTLNNRATIIAKKYIEQNKLEGAEIFAMPQPFSPYHWKVMIKLKNKYRVSYININSDEMKVVDKDAGFFEKINALYKPVGKNTWQEVDKYNGVDPELAEHVWSLDIMKPIRDFMLFPAVKQLKDEEKNKCIWYEDHRFILDGIRHAPFVFGACKEGQDWMLYRLRGEISVLMYD